MARRKNNGITNLRFNQDQGCFTCSLTTGLRVYNVEPLVEKAHYGVEEVGGVVACELVGRSNWVLVVRARRPCHLLLLDDAARKFRAEIAFAHPIRAVHARLDKVAVLCGGGVHVVSLPRLGAHCAVRVPPAAPPLLALTPAPAASHQLLVAPAHRPGALQILDLSRARAPGAGGGGASVSGGGAVLSCHQGALASLALSQSGARLATASERGTLIRIWDPISRTLLHELRRGSDRALLRDLCFSVRGNLVACVSDKGTAHVWALAPAPGARAQHVAQAHAPYAAKHRCQIAFLSDSAFVVICEDGTFHKYTFSPEGSCHRTDFDYFLQVGDDDDFIQ